MRFSFEEAELINNFFENINEKPDKEVIIDKLEQVKANTEETELIEIVNSIIKKLKQLDTNVLNKIFTELPIDIYTNY